VITVSLRQGSLALDSSQVFIAFVTDAEPTNTTVAALAKLFTPKLADLMKEAVFTGKAGSQRVLTLATEKSVATLLIMGVASKKQDTEVYRRAVGKAIKTMQSRKLSTATLLLPDADLFKTDAEWLIQETALTAAMAEFHFDDFISKQENKVTKNLALTILAEQMPPGAQDAINRGLTIAQGVNQARYWVDMPPSRLTPVDLAGNAQDVAKQFGLGCTVFSQKQIIEMGMGGLAGVSSGSDQECALAIMEYKTNAKAPTIALVGKGVTFDSGGLSIKPAEHMETMKDDMAGAAAVIATMQVIAQLKPKVNVIGVTPLTENLLGGKAMKPGDIVQFYNGKTAEVRNTDAEGRLILADALSYAVKHYKPDAIIDIATLTGACSYALGPFYSGLMSQHPELAAKIEEAAQRTGDRVWPLPMDDDYKVAIKSTIADICNIGNKKYRAGAITAAFFLQEFVGDVPWAHLDIAGTAFEVPDISYYDVGSTGVGVRLFVDLLMEWKS
jgi:leucyl aminopeptidase